MHFFWCSRLFPFWDNLIYAQSFAGLSMDRNQEQVPAEFAFFWNRNGFESIFHLPVQEQEFLNLRLILFMKGFLQLIAQFSSNLLAGCAITKCCKWVCICVAVQTSRTDSVSKVKMNWSRIWSRQKFIFEVECIFKHSNKLQIFLECVTCQYAIDV